MSLLSFNLVMIYIIHKMLVLLKNHLNYLKNNIFECIFKKYDRLLFFKEINFFHNIIMETLSFQEENIIKDIRNLFRLEKETKVIKDRIIRDIKKLFEHEEEENYYKPVRVSNFWSNNYIEFENNGDRNKPLSVKKYLNKKIISKNLTREKFN